MKLYWKSEGTPGTFAGGELTYLGAVTSFKPNFNPEQPEISASGNKDPYAIPLLCLAPEAQISVQLADVAYLTACVSEEQAHTLVVTDGSKYVSLLGAYYSDGTVKCDVKGVAMLDFKVVAMSMDFTARGTFPDDSTTIIPFTKVVFSKATVALDDWTSVGFQLDKKPIPRHKDSDGTIYAIEFASRKHEFNITRDMQSGDAFNEWSDQSAGTARAIKLKLTNSGNSTAWSITGAACKVMNFDADMCKPEDLIGKEIKYQAYGEDALEFGTS